MKTHVLQKITKNVPAITRKSSATGTTLVNKKIKKTVLIGLVALTTQANAQSWSLTGNAGTNSATNFVGTTDDKPLHFRVFGSRAGTVSTGTTVSLGYKALEVSTGGYCTAMGRYTLKNNTTGQGNTAFGTEALYFTTTGSRNVALGALAIGSNVSGSDNIAVGYNSLFANTASGNIAIGTDVLMSNTSGNKNTATGLDAMRNNTLGFENLALGYNALSGNIDGDYNVAIGSGTLIINTTGNKNTALGYLAGPSGPGTTGLTNTTALGNGAVVNASNQVRIGNSAVTSIGGQVSWTTLSDGRMKKDIRETVPGLAFISKLRPVTYHLDVAAINSFLHARDAEEALRGIPELHTGFIAQEVEKAALELGYEFSGIDKPQKEGGLYGLRYAEFTVPLIKAVQELNAKNDAKEKEISVLNDKVKSLEDKLNKLLHSKTTGASEVELKDGHFLVLDQNAPNPFSESTTISYDIRQDFKTAVLSISNSEGKVIKTQTLDCKGQCGLTVYGSDLSSGMYHYSLIVDGKVVETKRMIKK